MKLIIDIPEKIIAHIRSDYGHGCKVIYDKDRDTIVDAIYHATPLPKGHGRLGDLDALEKLCTEHDIANSAYDSSPIIEQGHYSDGDCIWKPLFDFAPTVIEAER